MFFARRTNLGVSEGKEWEKLSRFSTVTLLFCLFCSAGERAAAEPVQAWPQPGGSASPVFITYSYSNLLDGRFLLASPVELRAATEEALRLWTAFAPLHFIEHPDSGPAPSDLSYDAAGHPQIRIGHQAMVDLAHGFYPGLSDGLSGDVHVNEGIPWSLGEGHWNFLEAITHELGHALGLDHELVRPAIMNPSYPQRRFFGLGTAFLLPPDIEAIQALYGRGRGSVRPLAAAPEPACVMLVTTGLAGLAYYRRRSRARSRGPARRTS